MARTMLEVQGLSKSYPLRTPTSSEETLVRQAVTSGRELLQRLRRGPPAAADDKGLHWALRNINLSVAEGEVVSVIGHNGSGKSTLLKILSRITGPTEGRVRVTGRLASLLEVGTGFHPDLSGRDNIFLNAAILGMSRDEIRRRFDAIVAFSGVEAFIDTPVKNYSSGMKVRLGFAVAAHIDPDVLLIDEVLAVGDASFQQRCLKRIEEFGSSGRTILYVSHHLPSVARLSHRTVVLNQGQVTFDGPTLAAIHHYEQHIGGFRAQRQWNPASAPGDDSARLLALEITSGGLPICGPVDVRQPVELTLRYEVFIGGLPIMPSLHLHDFGGTPVLSSVDIHPEWHGQARPTGVYETKAVLPGNWFNEGNFQVAVALSTLEPYRCHVYVPDALAFSLYDPMIGDSTRGQYSGSLKGYMRPLLDWQTQRISG
ncbi:MAG: ABC transporter ATP-binding protein [Pseudomonadota bacterium]